jgi:lantibiotic modifying enzyme
MDGAARQEIGRVLGIGGGSGAGSLVYALVKAGQLLGEDLQPEALALAELVSPESIDADRRLDVVSGSAGALLGLLALHRATGRDAVLERALACGQHLLDHRVSRDGRPRAWRTVARLPLAGFSHGAAGIAYALVRLYEASQDKRFLEAALEGIEYENSLFSRAEANWPDLRDTGPASGPLYLNQWCHGAAGIGLARLGCHRILGSSEILSDIEAAMALTRPDELLAIDHVCCGNMGRIEPLLIGARQLTRPEWGEGAAEIASNVVSRTWQTGSYRLSADTSCSAFSPGFFQGIAGIGYQLLRLAHPDRLPSVLLWE